MADGPGGEVATAGAPGAAQELETFVATVSHDLRAPVAALQGFVELLATTLADADVPPLVAVVIERMRANTDFMETLTRDLLHLASADRSDEEAGTADPGAVVDVVADALAHRFPAARFVVEPLPAVALAPVRLRQLMDNLLANAVAHAGRPDVTVRLTADRDGPEVVLRVTDDGVGIPREAHDRVFEAFRRVPGREPDRGTGLGLTICRRICERAGGSIRLLDHDGGASFEIRLPGR